MTLWESLRECQKNQDLKILLLQKFMPLLRKYARKLHYEDSLSDMIVEFFDLLNRLNPEQLCNKSDGAIVSYIANSVRNIYVKLLQKHMSCKHETYSWEELTDAQCLSNQISAYSNFDIFQDKSTSRKF